MLAEITIGAILCNVLSEAVSHGIQLSSTTVIDALTVEKLPKNHHIQRSIRKAFLQACCQQLAVYQKTAEAEPTAGDAADMHNAYLCQNSMRWAAIGINWGRSKFPDGFDQLGTVRAALDQIRSRIEPSKINNDDGASMSADLRQNLIVIAEQEMQRIGSWEELPEGLSNQLRDPKIGWFPVFSAFLAHQIKNDQNFRDITNAIMLRVIEDTQHSIKESISEYMAFSVDAQEETLKRLDAVASSGSETSNLYGSTLEAINLNLLDLSEDLESLVERLPFGAAYKGTAASESMKTIVERLTKFFSGRRDEISVIDQFVDERAVGQNSGYLVLTAPAGFGKSSLAAVWTEMCRLTPHRFVARHFCSVAAGERTTNPERILEHLFAQVAAVHNKTADLSAGLDGLVALLRETPPDDRQLVVWLDGLDEAQGLVSCILPRKLGEKRSLSSPPGRKIHQCQDI